MSPLPDLPELSIITVNYRSSGVLGACLRSIERSRTTVPYEVLVVDNATWDEGMDRLEKEWPRVRFVRLQENRGFGGGNNAGIEKARGKALLFLNPDTEVGADTLQILYDRLMGDPHAGMAGPKIFYADGSLQTRYLPKKMPTVFDFFCEITYLEKLFSGSAFFDAYHRARFACDREQELGQLSGACLMVKREAMEKTGVFDENFFLYFEETDWCERVRQAGYRLLYVPAATLVHHEGKSSGLDKRRSVELWHDSQLYLTRKHYGPAAALGLYAINLTGYALRILTAPVYVVKDRNWGKVKKNLWQLGYHLDLRHLGRVFDL